MSNARVFANRQEAGRLLAESLSARTYHSPVILALPRGGVPVAAEVAIALHAPLDLVLVRKIGAPGQPELAVAAVVDGDSPQLVINEDVRQLVHMSVQELAAAEAHELAEIERRRALYIGDQARAPIAGRTAIVVDDGIATGATVRAALKAVRRSNPEKLVLAVPVAPPETIDRLRSEVDDVVCLQTPAPFYAIGLYYDDFHQVGDDEVRALLAQAHALGDEQIVPTDDDRRAATA